MERCVRNYQLSKDIGLDYYSMWSNFQQKHGSVFPTTWFELDWPKSWDFSLEAKFKENHNLNSFRRFLLSNVVLFLERAGGTGEMIEFGSYYGFGSYLILNNSARHLNIVDSFQGVSEPGKYDGDYWKKNDMRVDREIIELNLSEFTGRFTIFEGWIPDVLAEISSSEFVFAHIDLDLFEPTSQSLHWVSERMNRRGIILCDDYGFATCPGATAACKEFEKESQWSLLPLPVGGCLFLNLTP